MFILQLIWLEPFKTASVFLEIDSQLMEFYKSPETVKRKQWLASILEKMAATYSVFE